MNAHALTVLEFHRVLEGVAARALSQMGRDRVTELRPRSEVGLVAVELARVQQLTFFLDRHTDWIGPDIPDAELALDRLGLEGSVLEPSELHALGRLLAAGRHLHEGIGPDRAQLPGFTSLFERLHRDREQEKRIFQVVDRDGAIKDSASSDLARIRRRLRQAHNRIVQALEKYLKSLPERIVVSDASVTIRDGRYVIPVRREGKGEVGGLVMDESATGATLFVEPPLALELMTELRELERDEAREVLRILREETEALRPYLLLLVGSLDALVEFDSLYARARTAISWDSTAPELLSPDSQELEVVNGRHPLLLSHADGSVVPFHLRMEPGERALVVSGPNTGGKSVFLKALGLIVTLAQSGVIPPVGPGTRLPVFKDVFADIGDEQSIAESLSTFSAHLGNLMEIIRDAGRDSLVLIDEMGTGTDPQEGAALSRAIIEDLVRRGALAVVTSHLGALKKLDRPGTGIVNASLQFDPDRIQPTYQLLKGRPGRSYGLAIARRLGFPPEILDRAESHLPEEEARMEDLLEALERKDREASELLSSVSRERAEAERLREELLRRETELRNREDSSGDRAREDARRLLLDARKEVEAAIREVRRAGQGADLDPKELERAAGRARRRVEEAARRHLPVTPHRRGRGAPEDLSPGDRVRLLDSGTEGEVVEVRDGKAVVETGGVRFQVSASELERKGPVPGVGEGASQGARSSGDPSERRTRAVGWTGPEGQVATEVDFRGYRVADLDFEVERALDQATLVGLGEIRIIHGKGTGALRTRVAEILEKDPRVRGYRLGRPGEGGAGVTVVTLR